MPLISYSQVHKRYPGGFEALRGVTLDIEAGEMLFITGRSGAGKSTLLKLLPAIERPTGGTVMVNGQNIGKLRHAAIPYVRRNLGLVFQDQKLLYDRTVLENVMLPMRVCGHAPQEAAKRARAALDKVGLLQKEKLDPAGLSGGEQQRVCIARAIVNRPAILIADEPTANLDAQSALNIMEMFRSFNQVGVTVVIASHDEHLVHRFATRSVALNQGRVTA
ncbi:MAG TPA: cell division ATP-binding protein FtsE [Burkholderiales bacterium]|jgi:Predicted ATPase involved in cell division